MSGRKAAPRAYRQSGAERARHRGLASPFRLYSPASSAADAQIKRPPPVYRRGKLGADVSGRWGRETQKGRPSANKKGEYPLKNRIKNETQVIALLDLQGCSSSPRAISIAQLNTLLCLHLRPINLVVYKCPYSLEGMGYLILRCASRLDAFSVYHIRTRLFCYALGRTTDAPEVRPTRSSRTKVSSSQISNAHDR